MECVKCTSTGDDCCHGDYSKFTTLKDAKRIAKFLNKEVRDVVSFYRLTKDDLETDIYKKKHHGYCYDLEIGGRLLCLKKKKDGSCGHQSRLGHCMIYPVSPLGCKIFPFWFDRKLIVDDNGLTCPIIEGRRESLDRRFKRMGKTRKEMQALGEQLEKEIKDYEKNILAFIKENRIESE